MQELVAEAEEEHTAYAAKKNAELQEMRSSIESQFAAAASKAEVARFERKMEEFAKFEHIVKLQEDLLPKMDRFTEMIGKFETENKSVVQCVLDFDAALCEKANKTALLTLRKEIGDSFVHLSRWSEMEKGLTSNDARR